MLGFLVGLYLERLLECAKFYRAEVLLRFSIIGNPLLGRSILGGSLLGWSNIDVSKAFSLSYVRVYLGKPFYVRVSFTRVSLKRV